MENKESKIPKEETLKKNVSLEKTVKYVVDNIENLFPNLGEGSHDAVCDFSEFYPA